MGARVTSTDISARRLEDASGRAAALGLDILFVRSDAANLSPIPDNSCDLVCSTNGFFVWIADLKAVFSSACRVLKPGGSYVFYDIHPFLRPWKDQSALEMRKTYFDTGPFPEKQPDGETHEFHWKVSDIINSLVEGGLSIRGLMETRAGDSRFWQGPSYGHGTDDNLLDWHKNPRAGLPSWLAVAAQKPTVTRN
jgi:ubiquinone/menaquinone biosynthesis C-methylase UbiE